MAAGSLLRPRPQDGLPFGAAVWALGYVVLPQAGLDEQIWKYDVETLARDLTAHLAYGVTTATAFSLLARLAVTRLRDPPPLPASVTRLRYAPNARLGRQE